MGQETVQTVERALKVLRTFDEDRTALGPSDLARSLGLPRTIIVRILNTLEQSGFVEREPESSRYRIGLAALEVGALYAASNPLLAAADEELASLVRHTGYTGYLGVLDGHEAIIISLHEGHYPVRFIWSVGDRLPVTTTALGKAILLHLPPEALDRVVGTDRLPGLTDRSIATREDLDRDLETARMRGWTAIQEESYPGVSAVGAAVLDPTGHPVAGISISFIDHPSSPAEFEELGRLVRDTAQAITTRVAAYSAYGQRVAQAPRTWRQRSVQTGVTGPLREGAE